MDLGLLFTTQVNATLESFIQFPLSDGSSPATLCPSLTTFCNANWGPQDASHPSPTNTRLVSIQESKSICGYIFFYGGHPILWKTHKEKWISRSSCEAEIKATDECIKIVQMHRNILSDLNLLTSSHPTPIYNDNKGAVDWSHSFSTKGMRHLNIQENAVREAQSLQEVNISHIAGTCNPADMGGIRFGNSNFQNSEISNFKLPCSRSCITVFKLVRLILSS